MSYEIRRPRLEDKSALDELLIEDYRKSGFTKPPLTEGQIERYTTEAWVAVNENDTPEAIALFSSLKPADLIPYEGHKDNPTPLERIKEKGSWLLNRDRIAYLLSAVSYEEEGPLSALVDEKQLLEPGVLRSVHVPLLQAEHDAHVFLAGRGFKDGPTGEQQLFGQRAPVILVSKRGWLKNRLLSAG